MPVRPIPPEHQALLGGPLPVRVAENSRGTAFQHRLVPENLARFEALYWRTWARLESRWVANEFGVPRHALALAYRLNFVRNAVEFILKDTATRAAFGDPDSEVRDDLPDRDRARVQEVRIVVNGREYLLLVFRNCTNIYHFANNHVVELRVS